MRACEDQISRVERHEARRVRNYSSWPVHQLSRVRVLHLLSVDEATDWELRSGAQLVTRHYRWSDGRISGRGGKLSKATVQDSNPPSGGVHLLQIEHSSTNHARGETWLWLSATASHKRRCSGLVPWQILHKAQHAANSKTDTPVNALSNQPLPAVLFPELKITCTHVVGDGKACDVGRRVGGLNAAA